MVGVVISGDVGKTDEIVSMQESDDTIDHGNVLQRFNFVSIK